MNKTNEEGMQLKSFYNVVNIVSDKFKVNPFFIDSNNKTGVLICADEFSLLTDAIKNAWTTHSTTERLSKLDSQ